jgi:DNA repair ATPase RecN
MDKKSIAYVKKAEERLTAMAEQLGEARYEAQRLLKQLGEKEKELNKSRQRFSELKGLMGEGQSAHQQDIGEIAEYAKTNQVLVEALQEIADGRGKYAKIAKQALGV